MDVKYYYVCRVGLPYMLLLMPMMFSCASSDAAQDIADCTQQLVGLATCLPYVGGNAKSPTPDCCSGLKQVLKTNKKCLCVVVRDRNDPQLGLTINVTLALGLPSVCNAPANVSNCPAVNRPCEMLGVASFSKINAIFYDLLDSALLHLAPNSPEAQVFYQYGHASNSTSASSPAASVKANATTPSASSSGTSVHQDQKSDGHYNGGRRWLGLEVIAGGLLIWVFNSNLII